MVCLLAVLLHRTIKLYDDTGKVYISPVPKQAEAPLPVTGTGT